MEEEFPQVTEHDDNSLLCLFVCEFFFLLNQETGPSKESQTVLAPRAREPKTDSSSEWLVERLVSEASR